MLILFVKGLVIGIAIAAPVGPIGILCINRSLHDGFKLGFITGLGAATADGVYGLIAGFGLTAISDLLIKEQTWIKLFGGIFLLYLGIKLLITPYKNRDMRTETTKTTTLAAYSSTFLLTITNPLTILSFIAVFAGLGLGSTSNTYLQATCLVVGIILGSAIWWLTLSSGIALFLHHRLDIKALKMINWFSGAIITAFGIFELYTLL